MTGLMQELPVQEEPVPETTNVALDDFNSDLHLTLDPDGYVRSLDAVPTFTNDLSLLHTVNRIKQVFF